MTRPELSLGHVEVPSERNVRQVAVEGAHRARITDIMRWPHRSKPSLRQMLAEKPATGETTASGDFDIDDVLRRFDELTQTLYELVGHRAPRALAHRQLTIRNFEARLRWTHRHAFDAFDCLQMCCEEVAGALFTAIDAAADGRSRAKNDLLYRLLTRACLTASEINAQLRTGHPLGARARWRTLHEIHVVATLLADGDDELTQRYIAHEHHLLGKDEIDRGTGDRVAGRRLLGTGLYTDEELAVIDSNFKHVGALFQPPITGENGWARILFPKDGEGGSSAFPKAVRFSDLEEKAGRDHHRPDYRASAHLIHADAVGLSYNRVDHLGDVVDLVGPANIGLGEPASAAATSLAEVSRVVANASPLADSETMTAMLRVLDQLAADVYTTFLDAQLNIDAMQAKLNNLRSPRQIWFTAHRGAELTKIAASRFARLRRWLGKDDLFSR